MAGRLARSAISSSCSDYTQVKENFQHKRVLWNEPLGAEGALMEDEEWDGPLLFRGSFRNVRSALGMVAIKLSTNVVSGDFMPNFLVICLNYH
jgi:hypothetical protein